MAASPDGDLAEVIEVQAGEGSAAGVQHTVNEDLHGSATVEAHAVAGAEIHGPIVRDRHTALDQHGDIGRDVHGRSYRYRKGTGEDVAEIGGRSRANGVKVQR